MLPRRSPPVAAPRGPGWLHPALVGAAVLMAVLPTSPSTVESVYSHGAYPILRQLVTAGTNRIPLVLFDWLLLGGSAAILGWCAWRLLRPGRHRRLRVLGALAARLTVLAAAIYLVFLVAWGLNYRRETLAAKLGYTEDRVTAAALDALAGAGVAHLNRLFEVIETRAWPRLEELPTDLGPAFERVQRELGASRPAPAVVPRRSLLTPYFRRAGIDGMFDPFSLQVLVNDTVLPFERPFVTAHEWAHLAGFAPRGGSQLRGVADLPRGRRAHAIQRVAVSGGAAPGRGPGIVAGGPRRAARSGPPRRLRRGARAHQPGGADRPGERAPA